MLFPWIHLNFQTCPQPHGGLQHEKLLLGKNDICFTQISPKRRKNPIYVWYYARLSQAQPQMSFQGFLTEQLGNPHQVFYSMRPLSLNICSKLGTPSVKRESKGHAEAGSLSLSGVDSALNLGQWHFAMVDIGVEPFITHGALGKIWFSWPHQMNTFPLTPAKESGKTLAEVGLPTSDLQVGRPT